MNTTDLKTIREYPNRFTWGRVARIHDIGPFPTQGDLPCTIVAPYTIVEYRPWGKTDVNFHVYCDGKDQSVGSKTMEPWRGRF